MDSLTEVLFGLIMTPAITLGAGLVVQEGEEAAKQLFVGILGSNLAWGFVDAAMYLMSCMLERSMESRLLAAIQKAPHEDDAIAIIAHELDPKLAPLTSKEESEESCTTESSRDSER